jgi:peptidoglycan/LPS O-acetylase OafA/YrhL
MPAFFAALVLVAVLSGPERLPSVLLSYASLGMLGWGMGNAPLWSLALEEILYTFHAGSRVIMRIYNLAVVLFCFVIVCTLWWYYRDLALPGRVPLHRLAGPVAAFFAGNILYFVWPKLKSVKVWAAFLALAAMSVFWFIPEKPYSILMAKVVLQSAAAVLLCLALPQMKVRIPDVSYGLYIYHWPVMMAVIGLGLRRWELFGATFAITLLLSTLSCFALERPALRLKNWRLKRDSGAPELEPGKAEVDTEASLLAMRP